MVRLLLLHVFLIVSLPTTLLILMVYFVFFIPFLYPLIYSLIGGAAGFAGKSAPLFERYMNLFSVKLFILLTMQKNTI